MKKYVGGGYELKKNRRWSALKVLRVVSLAFVVVAGSCAIKTRSSSEKNKTQVQKPNIILFFVDDLGWSDLGFRNPRFESPNIDFLSARGINFEQAYIASPTCSPSRATLQTGLHPARLKMVRHIPGGAKNGFDNYGRTNNPYNFLETDPAHVPSANWLPLQYTTYAEALKELGYYNSFIGKWHLGHEGFYPVNQGYDEQYGVSNFGHPHAYYPPYFMPSTDSSLLHVKGKYLTDLLTDKAVSFINNYKKDAPFMLTCSYYAVHTPHEGRRDLVAHFEKKGLEGKRAHHAAMVKATDESVGRILEAINKKGINDNTIIIFLSDQGGFFENKPFRGGKLNGEALYEGGARVPFFFYWPGVTRENTLSNTLVQSTDLFPTLVEIAGGQAGKYAPLDGVSLVPHIKSGQPIQREAIFGYRAYEDLYASVRSGAWKLLAFRSGKTELYNIKNDREESDNVAAKNPHILGQLKSRLITWEQAMGVSEYSGFR